MLRAILGVMLLLGGGVGSAYADTSSGQSGAVASDRPVAEPDNKRADAPVPTSGVIKPTPEASRDTTIKPPNVDPAMAIPPPGTPGGNPTVDPK
jgi:hypothetical protein